MIDELKLRIALLQRGISQARLAQKIGISPSVMSSLVRGYRKSEPKLRQKISQELNIREDLLFIKEEPKAA